MKPYIGRFAPSPTGALHIGSLFAALISFLEAKSKGGEWHLRVEDADPSRCIKSMIKEIPQTLEAFHLILGWRNRFTKSTGGSVSKLLRLSTGETLGLSLFVFAERVGA